MSDKQDSPVLENKEEEKNTVAAEQNTETTPETAQEPSQSVAEETASETAPIEEAAPAVAEATPAQEATPKAAKEDAEAGATKAAPAKDSAEVDPSTLPVYTGERGGQTYTFEQLKASSEDYTEDEFTQLASMYENTLNKIDEKEIVTGVVISVDEKYVVVDIGFKSEGIVPLNEFRAATLETLKPGDEVEVFLDKVEDREGQLILSRRKADILKAWEKIEAAHETGEVIEGLIKRRIKGGMVVDVFGIDAFLPGSQIDVRPVRDFDAYVNKTMEFQVVKLNMQAENVVVSHRALIESDLEDQRQVILESIEPGQVLEGVVKNITDFGVFIDLGGVDGLLHITDLSWGRVEHPSEIVSLDQKMNVAVIDYDAKSKRVSLGLKQLQPHPWDEIESKYPEGQRVQGRVVSIADYGAFVELEKGVEGLIHISEMSWTHHIKFPSQLVQKNDVVECVVLNINKQERKISLGIKQLQRDPWMDLAERYPIGSKHTGTVRNITNFGAFVELEPGIDGLVHVSDLSWTEKVEHPSKVVSKGQKLDVSILALDFENRRITLGHKQVLENPWEKMANEYKIGTSVSGVVAKVTERGMFVTLPMGVDAFLSAKKLAEPVESLPEAFKEGDTVEGKILEFDESSRTIELTQIDEDLSKAKPAKPAKKPKVVIPETSTPTLGEMSGLAEKLAAAQAKSDKAAAPAKPATKSKKAAKASADTDADVAKDAAEEEKAD